MAEQRFHLTSLGSAGLHRIDAPGASVLLVGPGKPLALLVYLAHAPNHSATRDELLDLLWAHVDPEKARATLRQTIYSLRNTLGETVISVDGRHVRLSEDVHTDTDGFWSAIQAGDATRAVECYRGAFLPNLGLSGGEGFEQWADGERARLERAYLRSAEALVREHLDRGHAAEAVRLARTLRDSYPLRQSIWRLLLEALQAAGENLSLRVTADALEQLLAAESQQPEPATAARLRMCRSGAEVSVASDSTALVAELVGREREFATLVEAWKASRTGSPRHAHIVGPAGLGKTRLLADVTLRVRALGGEVIVVRGHAAERAIPYALAADLAEALGSLPGAAAVSPAAAGVLVALAPALSSQLTVGAAAVERDDVLRQRVFALSELAGAASEEKPIGLLIDDLHWADPDSRQVIAGLANRLRGRVLLMTASRPTGDEGPATRDSVCLALEPLSSSSIRALVTSLGVALPNDAIDELADALFATTLGSPFLILQILDLAHDRRLLTRDGSALRCEDTPALIRHVRSGDALAERVEALEDDARRVLTVLAVGGMPLAVGTVAAAIEQPPARVDEMLITLASRGMATATANEWEAGHDVIAETVRRLLSTEDRRRVHGGLGQALASAATNATDYRVAARHLTDADEHVALALLLRQWIRALRREGDSRRTSEIAASLLGASTSGNERVRALVKRLPIHERMGPREHRVLWFATAAAALFVVSLGLKAREGPQLQLLVAPLPNDTTAEGTQAFQPTPLVEYRDERGRLIEAPGESVVVRVATGRGRIAGPERVPLVGGRAEFPKTGVQARGPIVLEFATTRGHAKVRVPFGDADRSRDHPLKLLSGELGGRTLDPANPELHVRRSAQVSGSVSVEYTSTFADATIWFAATPTWGSPRTSYASFGALSTPARARSRTERIQFTAPAQPGRYYYLFVWGPESSAEFLLSATNWAIGAPRWGDGNDIASTPIPVIEQAMRTGWLLPKVYKDFEGGRRYHEQRVAIAAIRVIVDSTP